MTNTWEGRRSAATDFPKIDQRRRERTLSRVEIEVIFIWMAFPLKWWVSMFCGPEKIKRLRVKGVVLTVPCATQRRLRFFFSLLQGSLYASRLANSRRCRHTLLHHGLIGSSDWLWLRASQPHKISPRLSLSLCFCPGYREGFLWKRGRDNGQFLSRKFILAEREGALKYFNKQDVSEIKNAWFKGPVSVLM